MGSQHYNLRSANTFIESSMHDLNTVEVRPGDIDGLDRDGVTGDSLDKDDEGNSVVSVVSLLLFYASDCYVFC